MCVHDISQIHSLLISGSCRVQCLAIINTIPPVYLNQNLMFPNEGTMAGPERIHEWLAESTLAFTGKRTLLYFPVFNYNVTSLNIYSLK